MKYKLHNMKFWFSWFKKDLGRLFYKLRGLNVRSGACCGSTMLPDVGKGRFVSVLRKGSIIQIIPEVDYSEYNKYGEVRLIPVKGHHGIMVEIIKDGKLKCRYTVDIEMFHKLADMNSEKE